MFSIYNMKALIHHVRKQPDHVRHLSALGCTAAFGIVVFAFWFHSFQTTTYALLNPGEGSETRSLAAGSDDSLFGGIGNTFGSMKAQIGDLFSGSSEVQNHDDASEIDQAHPLPVADDK